MVFDIHTDCCVLCTVLYETRGKYAVQWLLLSDWLRFRVRIRGSFFSHQWLAYYCLTSTIVLLGFSSVHVVHSGDRQPWCRVTGKVLSPQSSGPSIYMELVCASQHYRHNSGNRHYLYTPHTICLPHLVNPICVKRFHRHYCIYIAGNWNYGGTTTIDTALLILIRRYGYRGHCCARHIRIQQDTNVIKITPMTSGRSR